MFNLSKIQLRLVGLAGALILAVLFAIATPQATLAQGTTPADPCSTLAAAIIQKLGETGAVRVTIDPADACSFVVAPLGAVVAPSTSPLAAPAHISGTVPFTGTVLSNVAAAYQPSLDYAKDLHERRPANEQSTWVAQVIERAMVARYNVRLNAPQMLNDAVLAIQNMAQKVDAPRGSGPVVFAPGAPETVALTWYANIDDLELQKLVDAGFHLVYRLGEAALLLSPPDVISMDLGVSLQAPDWWVGVE